jgi:hypothetical protein
MLRAGRSKQRQVEDGFKNTALHGDLPVAAAHAEAAGTDDPAHDDAEAL